MLRDVERCKLYQLRLMRMCSSVVFEMLGTVTLLVSTAIRFRRQITSLSARPDLARHSRSIHHQHTLLIRLQEKGTRGKIWS